MKIIRLCDGRQMHDNFCLPASAVSFGIFDGVHIGHKALLEKTVSEADKHGYIPAVWTFDTEKLNRTDEITSMDEKLKLFFECGIEYACIEDFFSVKQMKPLEFIISLKKSALNCKTAVCGYNFTFGEGAKGNADDFVMLCSDNAINAYKIPEIMLDSGIEVSSTNVRQALKNGNLDLVARLLGRNHYHISEVLHGKAFGRTIGFPTVNQIFSENEIIPHKGVYATKISFNRYGALNSYYAVTNVGICPTVSENGKQTITCESNIIDFSDELYSETVKTEFISFIRDEIKFDSIEMLKNQIFHDRNYVIKNYCRK